MAERTAEAAEIGRRAAEQAIGTAQQGVRRVGEQVREAAESLLQEQKDRMADAVHGLADALRQTAHTLEREENVAVARYADQAAAQIDRLSENLRNRQLRDLLANVENLARRQPSLFMAGAVAAGFVIGRVLARPADNAASGYAMTGGEHAWHQGEERAQEPLAGYGPVTGQG
jgi:plasmid stabilization system protein ParE